MSHVYATAPSRRPRRALRAALGLAAVTALALPAAPALGRATNGTIANFAGTPGQSGFAGDGGPAGQALMNTPSDVAFLGNGSLVIADQLNDRVRRVTTSGQMQTAAGGGSCGSPPCGDGGPAGDAELNRPRGVTSMPDGGYLIADTLDHRIRRVFPDGHIETVAGTTRGLSGDGGSAKQARLDSPTDTALLPDGSFLIADTGNHRIRRVGLDGRISTAAGTSRGFGGDGGPATAARLDSPRDVATLSTGGFVIADTGNSRLRKVDLAGTISTLAGTSAGLSGDGDPALKGQLRQPFSVIGLPNGGTLVADTDNDRVRRVTPLGAIIAVAGTSGGNAGNGGPAQGAQLSHPNAVTLAPGGGFVVADTSNATVRRVSDFGAVPGAVLRRSLFVEPGGGNVTVQPSGAPAFLPLREEDIVPNGSRVDATTGTLSLFVARDGSNTQIGAKVFSGDFTMRQLGGTRPFTEFRLGALSGCPTGGGARASALPAAAPALALRARPLAMASAKKKKKKRKKRLWVSDRGGRWRTATGSVSAGSIGTKWLTTLRCDGTSITVREGRVRVFDKVRRRTRILRAGQTYLALNKRR
jgi:hypothetical protein